VVVVQAGIVIVIVVVVWAKVKGGIMVVVQVGLVVVV
jgi:hypothetical protein